MINRKETTMPRLGSGFSGPSRAVWLDNMLEMQSFRPHPRPAKSRTLGGGGHSLDIDRWFLSTSVWEELSCEKSILDGEFHRQHNSAVPGH